MKKTYIYLLALAGAGASSLSATSISLSAAADNLFGNSSNTALAQNSLLQIGTYDTGTSSFTLVDQSTIGVGVGFDGGISFDTTNFDSSASGLDNVGDQIAIRFFNSTTEDFSDYGLIYLEADSEWLVKPNASPIDNVNSLNLDSLTNGDGDTLLASAVIVQGTFGPGVDGISGAPFFQTSPVPEPSTYAALSGLLALVYVIVRRRR